MHQPSLCVGWRGGQFLPGPTLAAFLAFFASGAAGAAVGLRGASSIAGGGAPGRFEAMSAITSSVLPSPMSSARMPPRHGAGLVAVLWLLRGQGQLASSCHVTRCHIM